MNPKFAAIVKYPLPMTLNRKYTEKEIKSVSKYPSVSKKDQMSLSTEDQKNNPSHISNKRYHHIRIGSINVRTAKCESKLAEHVLHIQHLQHHVTCIQEARIKSQGEIVFQKGDPLHGWRVLHNGMKTANAGVAIVLAPHVILEDVEHIMDGRISAVRVEIYGVKLVIFSCYGPTEQHSETTKSVFYDKLRKAVIEMEKNHPSFKIILAGDFNASIGDDCSPDSWQCVGKFHDNIETSFNGTKLIETSENLRLKILNTMFEPKNERHRFTFNSNLGYSRRLDYIICDGYLRKFVKQCRAYPGSSEEFDSDHVMVVADFYCPSKLRRKQLFGKNSKLNPKKQRVAKRQTKLLCDDKNLREQFCKALDKQFSEPPVLNLNVDILEQEISMGILKAAEVIPKAEKQLDKKPWMNDQFLVLVKKRQQTKDKIIKKTIMKEIVKMRTNLKNAYFLDKAKSINLASEARDTEEEFCRAKKYTSITRSQKILVSEKALAKHFENHFANRDHLVDQNQPEITNPENYPHILPPLDLDPIKEDPPDADEISAAISKFNNGKCEGTDSLKAEHFKYGTSQRLILYLSILLGLIWSTLTIPKEWLNASVTCLHKKGPKSLPQNYRGISIISTMSKLISMIFVNRIRKNYERILLPTQFGFRANKSTTDAIFITSRIIQQSKANGKPLYIAFIDLKAAYDWIPRPMLFRVLKNRLKLGKLIDVLALLYQGTKAYIKGCDETFDTFVGCRQGALESPPSFNVYMDFVVRCARVEIKKRYPNSGFTLDFSIPNECSTREMRRQAKQRGKRTIDELLYADDEEVFANSEIELKGILEIYDKTFTRFGLTMAYSKTETMVFNVPEEIKARKSLFSINGNEIKNVQTFKYLGNGFTNDACIPKHFLHLRIASAFSKWSELKHVFTDKRIYLSTRIKILTACVRSRLVYGCQAWEPNTADMKKIETIWNGFLRKMVKGGYERRSAQRKRKHNERANNQEQTEGEFDWRFKISNEQLYEITGTGPISNFCEVQYLKYIGHVVRMDNDSPQKQALFDIRTSNRTWTKMEKMLDLDRRQVWRTMMNREGFMELLDKIYQPAKQSHPKLRKSTNGNQ